MASSRRFFARKSERLRSCCFGPGKLSALVCAALGLALRRSCSGGAAMVLDGRKAVFVVGNEAADVDSWLA